MTRTRRQKQNARRASSSVTRFLTFVNNTPCDTCPEAEDPPQGVGLLLCLSHRVTARRGDYLIAAWRRFVRDVDNDPTIDDWADSDPLLASAFSGLVTPRRLPDLRCCVACRHWFLAKHDRTRYCSSQCKERARPLRKRSRALYMRKYRQVLADLDAGKAVR